jgi:hypothetical protein
VTSVGAAPAETKLRRAAKKQSRGETRRTSMLSRWNPFLDLIVSVGQIFNSVFCAVAALHHADQIRSDRYRCETFNADGDVRLGPPSQHVTMAGMIRQNPRNSKISL